MTTLGLLLLAWLQVVLSFGAVISTPTPERSNGIEARKVAASLMTFPVPSCSSSGIIESITSDRCVRLSELRRVKGLVPRQITSGCRVLAFPNENCSGPPTRLIVNRCYDMRNYTALVADC